jgi:NADPH:quinone reductase-like Zn-dependent oxidoreductase
MRAEQILKTGPPGVIQSVELPQPTPKSGEVIVRVKAAGVGPWDALIREGKTALKIYPPIILGADVAGTVEAIGEGVTGFEKGEEVYGSTNSNFIGAYAEFAVCSAKMIARKPKTINFIEAGAAPVVAVTAWQMIHDYAHAKAGQTVLIHGAAGSVGACAVQLAKLAQLKIIATASAGDADYVRSLGAEKVLDYRGAHFEDDIAPVDIVLDLVGGETQERSFRVLRPSGILVSVVEPIPEGTEKKYGVKAVFFYVEVTTERLNTLTKLFDSGELHVEVGTVLPLNQAPKAHEMLAGAPHKRGKIVLELSA